MGLKRLLGSGLFHKGVVWLLRDDFIDTRAAGSVNGTPATPGPGGPRVVADAESKLSLVGGNVVFASGKAVPGWGDPAIWWAAQTRTAGLAYFSTIYATTLDLLGYGFDNDQAGSPGANALVIDGSKQARYFANDGAVSIKITSALSDTTAYEVAVILRSKGAFLYIKGGIFTVWTLLYIGDTNIAVTVYPTIVNNDAVGVLSSFVRVVQLIASNPALYPVPALADSFTLGIGGSDGKLNNGDEVPSAAGIVHMAGGWAVAGGVATNTPVPGAELLANPGVPFTFTADDPDGFTVVEGVNHEVGEVATGEFHADVPNVGGGFLNMWRGNGTNAQISEAVAVVGNWYRIETVVNADNGGQILFGIPGGTTTATAVGTKAITARATGTTPLWRTNAVTDMTLTSVSVKNLPLSECLSAAATFNSALLDELIVRVGVTVAEGFQTGAAVLLDDANNPTAGFIGYYDQNDNKVKVWDENGQSELLAVAAAHSAGAALELRVVGTDLWVWYNDVYIGNVTISLTNTGDEYAMFSTDSANVIAWLEVWPSTEQDYARYTQ